MAVTLASLPPEVLLQIFRHLCHTDLNTVARVSWRLYALGTLPSLWRHFNLKVCGQWEGKWMVTSCFYRSSSRRRRLIASYSSHRH